MDKIPIQAAKSSNANGWRDCAEKKRLVLSLAAGL